MTDGKTSSLSGMLIAEYCCPVDGIFILPGSAGVVANLLAPPRPKVMGNLK
jgi:hypothetical protein